MNEPTPAFMTMPDEEDYRTGSQDEDLMMLGHRLAGGVAREARVAIAIAEAVLLGLGDEARLNRQQPLVAYDEGDRWLVEGKINADNTWPHDELAIVELKKSTGRILMLLYKDKKPVFEPHPEALKIIKEAEKNRQFTTKERRRRRMPPA